MSKPTVNKICENLRDSMKAAGIYEEWLEPQIVKTAKCWLKLDEMNTIVEKSNYIVTTIGSQGQEKQEAHPLLPQINQFNRTLTQDLSALGLNRLKAQAEKDTKDMDRLKEMFS